jgi:hypothetical protein
MNYNTFLEMYQEAKANYPEYYNKILDIWISDWTFSRHIKTKHKGSRGKSLYFKGILVNFF